MYYEEQWIEGALCWRTSPNGAWTRYTANELAHRYESAEKRAADAQATVEALQKKLVQEQALNTVRRDAWWQSVKELEAALDAEREKVAFVEKTAADFQVLWRAACDQREAFETQLSQLQALVRALPVVKGKFEVGSGVFYYVRALDGKENPVVCGLMTEQATAFAIKALLAYRASLDATTPDSNQLGAINDMVSKGGNGE